MASLGVESQAGEARREQLAFTEVYRDLESRELRRSADESFAGLVARGGANPSDVEALAAATSRLQLSSEPPAGSDVALYFRRSEPGAVLLVGAAWRPAPGASLTMSRTAAGFVARRAETPVTFSIGRAAGAVGLNLAATAQARGASEREVSAFAGVLAYEIDFQRDIGPNDRFEMLFERYSDHNGHTVSTGEMLFVALDTRRFGPRRFYAFQAPDEPTRNWYDSRGRSARRFLMMTPVNGARLNSRFGLRRDPFLGFSRQHRGVDFGAPTGAPVQAAGDGIVVRAGPNGSFGTYIRLRHGSGYETAYAHLLRLAFAVRPGALVRQGQTIGYVGSSGRSSGPHLHYEVILNGQQINPMLLRSAAGANLAGPALALFRAEVDRVDGLRNAALLAARRADGSVSSRLSGF